MDSAVIPAPQNSQVDSPGQVLNAPRRSAAAASGDDALTLDDDFFLDVSEDPKAGVADDPGQHMSRGKASEVKGPAGGPLQTVADRGDIGVAALPPSKARYATISSSTTSASTFDGFSSLDGPGTTDMALPSSGTRSSLTAPPALIIRQPV